MKEIKDFIQNEDLVKIKIVKDAIIVSNTNQLNHRPTLIKIGNHRLINLRTGEVIEETKKEKRGDYIPSLLISNLRLQDIIKENAVDNK